MSDPTLNDHLRTSAQSRIRSLELNRRTLAVRMTELTSIIDAVDVLELRLVDMRLDLPAFVAWMHLDRSRFTRLRELPIILLIEAFEKSRMFSFLLRPVRIDAKAFLRAVLVRFHEERECVRAKLAEIDFVLSQDHKVLHGLEVERTEIQ